MSHAACEQARVAERYVDGRLDAQSASAFLCHVQSCQRCGDELAFLQTLQSQASRLPSWSLSDFERRRGAALLLRRAQQGRASRMRIRPSLLAAAACAMALLVWVFTLTGPDIPAVATLDQSAKQELGQKRGPDPNEPAPAGRGQATPSTLSHAAADSAVADPGVTPPAAPQFQVLNASDAAVVQVVDSGPTTRLKLQAGRLSLQVTKLNEKQRFLVQLPDGELEVKGTAFTVFVSDGKTRTVSVSEGVVALRVGGSERRLARGESWDSSAREPELATPRGSKPVARAPSTAPSAARPKQHGSSPPKQPALATGAEFAAAIALFKQADYGPASEALLSFARRHPQDSRAEDANYLAAVARARLGQQEAARAAARRYLERYPNGLRRPEVDAILTGHGD